MPRAGTRPAKPGARPNGGKRGGQGRWGSAWIQCRVCQHPERSKIDYLLAGGATLRPVGQQFGLPIQNLSNHFRLHVSARYKAMVGATHLASFEAMLRDATEANAETVDLINLLIKGHMSRWAVQLEAGADDLMGKHSGRVAQLLELRSRITLELQPETRNLVVNNYLIRDAASLVDVLKDNPTAIAQVEAWYSARMDRKLIEHDEVKGRAAAAD
jgi:hypothetical protein